MEKLAWDKFEMFLEGTFHQDIESPEEALEEYIKDVGKEWVSDIASEAKLFLKSDLSEYDKNEFIQNRVEIYFPAMKQTPLQWLESVIVYMIEYIKYR